MWQKREKRPKKSTVVFLAGYNMFDVMHKCLTLSLSVQLRNIYTFSFINLEIRKSFNVTNYVKNSRK